MEGPFVQWNSESGRLTKVGTYKNSSLDGVITTYTTYGTISEYLSYDEGEQVGGGAKVRPTETPSILPFECPDAHVYGVKSDDEDGKFSLWCEDTYGQLDGPGGKWFPSGKIAFWVEMENGSVKGEAVNLWESGRPVSSGTNENGQKEGPWVYWYENGNKKREGKYKANLHEGFWTFWHETGQKKEEGEYKAGLKTGKWAEYDEQGNLVRKCWWRADELQDCLSP